jgi:hypothetical protein
VPASSAKKPTRKAAGLRPAELKTIRAFAAGDQDLRSKSIDIFRAHPGVRERACPALLFMAEIDTPCPDLALRGEYRKTLLNGR